MFGKFNRVNLIIATAIGIFLGVGTQTRSVLASTISLENSGFEIPEQTNALIPGVGFFDFETPPGWDLYDPNSLIPDDASLATSFTGGWKPSEAFFATIPEGEQIGSIFLVPPGAGEVGFAQNSGAIIQPETTYTLSAAVLDVPGLPGAEGFEGFPGYRLDLLAGDNVIATDNNSVVINEGGFETATLSYTSSSNDLYLGEALSIRLINLNLDDGNGFNDGNGIEVNFDDVRLTATSVSVSESRSIIGYLVLASVLIPIKKKLSKK